MGKLVVLFRTILEALIIKNIHELGINLPKRKKKKKSELQYRNLLRLEIGIADFQGAEIKLNC